VQFHGEQKELIVKQTRRQMMQTALTAGAFSLAGTTARGAGDGGAGAMIPLDYGRSFICNTASFNAVRFWVESRTRLIDVEAGTQTDFLQCGSCKSEDTFAEKELFKEDNYDFLPILGDGEWLVFRRTVRLSERYRTVHPVEKLWGAPELKLREAPETTRLDSWEQLRDATAAAIPIVTQTEIWSPDEKLRAIIECPTKTMNVDLDGKRYQVDTGPVAYADLTKDYPAHIDRLQLAFVAFNAPDFADWVVEQPTRVYPDDSNTTEVYHYAKPFSLPAKNSVIALGKL
jgi:hypothetical protein